jgi:hypothetical protein
MAHPQSILLNGIANNPAITTAYINGISTPALDFKKVITGTAANIANITSGKLAIHCNILKTKGWADSGYWERVIAVKTIATINMIKEKTR